MCVCVCVCVCVLVFITVWGHRSVYTVTMWGPLTVWGPKMRSPDCFPS